MARPTNVAPVGEFNDQRADWKLMGDVVSDEEMAALSKFQDGEVPENPTYTWFAELIKATERKIAQQEGSDSVIQPANKTVPYTNVVKEYDEARGLTRMNRNSPSRTNTKAYQVAALMRLHAQWIEKDVLGRQGSKNEANSGDAGREIGALQTFVGPGTVTTTSGVREASSLILENVVEGSTSSNSGAWNPGTGLTSDVTPKSSATDGVDFDVDDLNTLLEKLHNKGIKPKGYCIFTTTNLLLKLAKIATNSARRQYLYSGEGGNRITDYVDFYESEAGFMLELVASSNMERHGFGSGNNLADDLIIADPDYIENHWKDKMEVIDLAVTGPSEKFTVYSAYTVSVENPNRHAAMRGLK